MRYLSSNIFYLAGCGWLHIEAGNAEKAAVPFSEAHLATAAGAGWAAAAKHPWGSIAQRCLLRQIAEVSVRVGYFAALHGHSAGQLQLHDHPGRAACGPLLDSRCVLQQGRNSLCDLPS